MNESPVPTWASATRQACLRRWRWRSIRASPMRLRPSACAQERPSPKPTRPPAHYSSRRA